MSSAPRLREIAASLLAQRDLELISCISIQTLWADYGQICQVQARPRERESAAEDTAQGDVALVLKYISPPPGVDIHDEGYVRKILSYQVEQFFYTNLAVGLPQSVAVPECIASIHDGTTTAILLKDLRSSSCHYKPNLSFPVSLEKRGKLDQNQVLGAVSWLARFHGHFWGKVVDLNRSELVCPPLLEIDKQAGKGGERPPDRQPRHHFHVNGIWLNGGYTYLATRRKEYRELAGDGTSEWSKPLCEPRTTGGLAVAEKVANFLAPQADLDCQSPVSGYETVIHGDVKSENMFASLSGSEIAFFDFQYVGLGLGVCDLAKLFTCSVPLSMLMDDYADRSIGEELGMAAGEKYLLSKYVEELEREAEREYPWSTFVKHWELALIDWLRFQASWGFWGNTQWLKARVRHILRENMN